jgi:hypothetical protein
MTRSALLLLGAVAAVALLALGIPRPAAAAGCEAKTPEVSINMPLQEPVVDSSLAQPALQQLSDQFVPGRHGGRTLGLYRSRLMTSYTTKMRITTSSDSVCISIASVQIVFTMPERRIYVAGEWKPGTCGYTAILEHERKHQAADDQVIREHLQRFRRAVESAVVKAGALAVPTAQSATAQDRLEKVVQAAVESEFQELTAEQKSMQQEVDAGLEYARVRASCSQFG